MNEELKKELENIYYELFGTGMYPPYYEQKIEDKIEIIRKAVLLLLKIKLNE
jgi:hypothetical protein